MTEFSYRKSQQNLSWSPFFLAITTPHAHGDLDDSIMSYSSRVSISFLQAFDFFGVIRLAPSLCGTDNSSNYISCSVKLQHPMSALCLEKTSWFRSSTSLMASSCSYVTFLRLKCSISDNTGLSISYSSGVGLSGKFEELDSPSSVSDVSDFTRPDDYFVFFNRLKILILSL